MTIIAHVADIHLNERDKHMTLEEQRELLKWIGEDAIRSGAETMLVAGDVFDRASTPAERNTLIDVVKLWTKLMRVVFVRGNHDRPGDLAFLEHIGRNCFVAERPMVLPFSDVTVACLPWPNKASLAAATHIDDQVSLSQTATKLMETVLKWFSVQLERSSAPGVLLAHAELGQAVMGTGQPVSPHADISLSAEDLLETGADYIALGHIHKHQVLRERICYSGAVRQCTFGEDRVKGYCLVDVTKHRVDVAHRVAPFRELISIDGEPDGEGNMDWNATGYFDGDDVDDRCFRLHYEVNGHLRASARNQAEDAKMRLLGFGAHSVKIDGKVRPVHRVRSTAISSAATTEDRIRAWWEQSGEPARVKEIMAKLDMLEAGVKE